MARKLIDFSLRTHNSGHYNASASDPHNSPQLAYNRVTQKRESINKQEDILPDEFMSLLKDIGLFFQFDEPQKKLYNRFMLLVTEFTREEIDTDKLLEEMQNQGLERVEKYVGLVSDHLSELSRLIDAQPDSTLDISHSSQEQAVKLWLEEIHEHLRTVATQDINLISHSIKQKCAHKGRETPEAEMCYKDLEHWERFLNSLDKKNLLDLAIFDRQALLRN